MQEGTWHSLRQMNTLDPSKVKQMDLKFDGGDLSCKNCKLDIEMHEVSPPDANWIRFYEYKSYKNPAEIDIAQFKNYIGSITNLKQLRYVFEESKLTASGISAKDGMKAFFVKNYDTIWTTAEPKGLFSGLKLKNGTVVDDKLLFKEYLSEIESSNSLFDFVDSI